MSDMPMDLAQDAYRLHAEQKDDEAQVYLDKALEMEPTLTGALMLKGILALAHGDYRTGLSLFELRHQCIDAGRYGSRYQDRARWDGSPTDKKVLIWADEGLGDSVMMLRFMPEVHKRCPNLQLELQYPLVRLAKANKLAPDIVAVAEEPLDFDLQCSLLSLPLVLRKELKDIPSEPYLKAPPHLVEDWKGRKPENLKLGICWTGNRMNARDEVRSIPQKFLFPLIGQFDFIALSREHTEYDDVADMAALIAHLDIVVTVDTLTAHVAGALGKPTYLMLGTDCDWRWLQKRSNSPWYNSMTLFRQSFWGDWGPVIDQVILKLRETHAKTFILRGPGAESGSDGHSRDGAISSMAGANAA